MKLLSGLLLWLAIGVAVFMASFIGILGMQGRLTLSELSRFPGLEGIHGDEPGPSAAPTGSELGEARRSGKEAGGFRAASLGALLGRVSLPQPFTVDELGVLFEGLREARGEYAKRVQALDERERRLTRMGSDLEERRKELDKLRLAIGAEAERLVAERQRLEEDLVRLEAAEMVNAKKNAERYSQMKPDSAARAMMELADEEAVKILARMDARKAAKILEVMDPERAAGYTKRLSHLLEEEAARR